MMLRADSMNHLSFDLSVIGTANKPTSVRCVLGSNPTASFEAQPDEGTMWVCDVDLPLFIEANEVPFKVEVLINGRLFTPLSTTLKVDRTPRIDTKVPEPEVVELPDIPMAAPEQAVEEVPEAAVPEAQEEPVVSESVIEKQADEKKRVAEALTKIFEATPIIKQPPKKTGSVFAQIDEMAGPAKIAPAPAPKIKPRRISIPESRPSKVVVHVTKGPVVYK